MAKALGYTEREAAFNRASAYYWGRQYDHLEPWETKDIQLRDKAPSVQIALTKKAVNRINAHLFGEGRAPTWKIEQDDQDVEDALVALVSDCGIRRKYSEIGRLGCLHGTVAVGFHIFDGGRIDTEIINAGKARPVFGRDRRRDAVELDIGFDELIELDEYWRTFKDDEESGERKEFWHKRTWTTTQTIEYFEIEGPINEGDLDIAGKVKFTINEDDTVTHDLKFVPVEWITPIPVSDDIDGAPIVDAPEFKLEDEVNYTLSQTGRGIRYSQEPTLVISGVDMVGEEPIKKGGDNSILVRKSADGTQNADAKYLEMAGNGPDVAMNYARMVRNLFNEIVQVVDHDPAQFVGAASGVALERLLYPMLMLVQNLRPEYEEKIGRLLHKMLRAIKVINSGDDIRVSAVWPPIVTPTAVDLREYATAITQLYDIGIVDRRKAVEYLAPFLDIEDVDAYLDQVDGAAASGGTVDVNQSE